MIRINLLSTGPKGRPAKPQYDVRAQVLLGVGLLVMALALAATSFVAFDLLPSIPAERRVRVKRLGIVCLVLAALCLIVAFFVW